MNFRRPGVITWRTSIIYRPLRDSSRPVREFAPSARIRAQGANSRKCTTVIYRSLSKLQPCKISAISRHKPPKIAIFSLIHDFLCPTSGGKNASVRAILDGFENVFLENVRKTEICRIALSEF